MNRAAGDLRIPKHRVRVELCFQAGLARQAEVCIAEHDARTWRRQEVHELFENGPPFLPAHDLEAGSWMVLSRDALLWVRIVDAPPRDDLAPGDGDELFDIQRGVRVELSGGSEIAGDLLYSPPPGHARVADFLNEPGRFFPLWTGGGELLVNKAHVVRVFETAKS